MQSRLEFLVIAALAVALVLTALVLAAYLVVRICKRYSECWQPDRTDNGVRVGAPKVYDNRSLTLMLEELQNQLKALESIDGGSLKNSLGTTQSERSESIDASVGLAFSVMPVAPEKGAGGSKDSSVAAPSDAATSRVDRSPITPPALSERAADLLDDQINLSYQIFNLRLLLERAISDRLTDDFQPRIQAVVALPISIDTPEFAVGCAATVEVRFSVRGESRAPSLVALFPQEETYNTLSAERRSVRGNARVGSGAASGSGGIARSVDASAIRRQSDIVAVERQPNEARAKRRKGDATPEEASRPEAGQLVVAWQFRPSAGERSVKSGLRQVLAVLALPSSADSGQEIKDIKVKVEVRSIWQTWNARTGTSANGAGWRAVFTDRPARHIFGSYGDVSVPLAKVLDGTLEPRIDSIKWFRIGPSGACVTLIGKNFFTGTTAVMGDMIIGAGNGLTVKSEQTLQIIVPVAALLDDALLNGRYGPSREIALAPEGVPPLEIANVWITPKPGNQSYEVVLDLKARDNEPLTWATFGKLPAPIFAINKNVLPSSLQYDAPGVTDDKGYRVTARAILAPEALSGRSLLVAVRWPFFGKAWSLQYQTYNSAAPLSVVRSDSGGQVALLIFGRDFDSDVRVIVDRVYRVTTDPELGWAGSDDGAVSDVLRLTLSRTIVDAHREVLVLQDGRATVAVAIPPADVAAAASLDLSQEPHLVPANAACSIDFTGTGLDAIHRVRLNGHEQEFAAYRAGTSIKVLIDGASIANKGKCEVEFETQAGQQLKAPLFVVASNDAAVDGVRPSG